MVTKEELKKYLNGKREALDFWTGLRDVMPLENKIALLHREIAEVEKELEELKAAEKTQKESGQNEVILYREPA